MTDKESVESLPFKRKRKVADWVGAITANVYLLLVSVVFITRILDWLLIERWVGFASSLVIFPLVYLFVVGLRTSRLQALLRVAEFDGIICLNRTDC